MNKITKDMIQPGKTLLAFTHNCNLTKTVASLKKAVEECGLVPFYCFPNKYVLRVQSEKEHSFSSENSWSFKELGGVLQGNGVMILNLLEFDILTVLSIL